MLCLISFNSIQVLRQLNLPVETQISLSDEKGDVEITKRPWEILPAGHRIGTPAPLFKGLVLFMHLIIYLMFYQFAAMPRVIMRIVARQIVTMLLIICRKMRKSSSLGRNLLEIKLIGLIRGWLLQVSKIDFNQREEYLD